MATPDEVVYAPSGATFKITELDSLTPTVGNTVLVLILPPKTRTNNLDPRFLSHAALETQYIFTVHNLNRQMGYAFRFGWLEIA
jgi:hypothetical protein